MFRFTQQDTAVRPSPKMHVILSLERRILVTACHHITVETSFCFAHIVPRYYPRTLWLLRRS